MEKRNRIERFGGDLEGVEQAPACYFIFRDKEQSDMALAHGVKDWEGIKNAALTARASYRSLFSYHYGHYEGICGAIKRGDDSLANRRGQPKLGQIDPDEPYTAREVVMDIDGDQLSFVGPSVRKLCQWLESHYITHQLFHSGKKGYHVHIPRSSVGYGTRVHDMAQKMGRFVRRLVKRFHEETGCPVPPIDYSLYNKTRKIRLAGDCRGELKGHVRYKAPLEPADMKIETIWGWDHATQQPNRVEMLTSGYPDGHPMLRELWDEATTDNRPVVVHEARSHVGSRRDLDIQNLDDLINAVRNTRNVDEKPDGWVNHRCLNPSHDDTIDSAGIHRESGAYKCFKCGNFSPQEVAGWLGVDLEIEDNDEDDDETSLEETRTRLMREMRGALYGDSNVLWNVSVGVGKSYTMRRLARESDPTVVVDEGDYARTLGPDDLPDDVLAQIGHGTLSEDPEDHQSWLPEWAMAADYIDWQPQDGRTFGFMADSYDLIESQKEDLNIGLMLHKPWRLEPRCESTDMDRSGDRQTRAEEIKLRQQKYKESRSSVCATCPLNPDSDAWDPEDDTPPCEYLEQRDEMLETEGVVWLPKAFLGHPETMRKFTEQCSHIIVDEDILEYLWTAKSFRVPDLKKGLSSAVEVPWGGDGDPSKRVGEVIDKLLDDELPLQGDIEGDDRDPIDGGINLVESWARRGDYQGDQSDEGTWAPQNGRVHNIGHEDAEGPVDVGFDDMEVNTTVQDLVMYLRTNNIHGIDRREDDDGVDHLYLQGSPTWTEYLQSAKFHVLDASIDSRDEKILQHHLTRRVQEWTQEEWEEARSDIIADRKNQWLKEHSVGDGEEMPDFDEIVPETPPNDGLTTIEPERRTIQLQTNTTNVVHDPSSLFSRDGQMNLVESYENDDSYNRLEALVEFVDAMVEDDGAENIGFISQKPKPDNHFMQFLFQEVETDAFLDDDGEIDDASFLYYGNLRGFDRFREKDNVVIIGDPGLPESAYRTEMMRLAGQARKTPAEGGSEDITSMILPHTVKDRSYTLKYQSLAPQVHDERQHPDAGNREDHRHHYSMVQFAWDRQICREIYQAVGRARGHEHDSTIYLLAAAHPGEQTKQEFKYDIDEELLVSKSSQARHVQSIDLEAHRAASFLMNNTLMPVSQIMNETELSRKQINGKLRYDAKRLHKEELCFALKKNGVGVTKISDILGVARKSVYRWIDKVEDRDQSLPDQDGGQEFPTGKDAILDWIQSHGQS